MQAFAEEVGRHRFTINEVMQMMRAGVFDDQRVELLEGELLDMPPSDPPHAYAVALLNGRLVRLYSDGAHVRCQLQIDVTELSQPEPDVAVVRGDEHTYADHHPRGSDCLLVVEVSWSSHRRDLRKAAIYASSGVLVYWILDVHHRRLTVHEGPTPDGNYATVRILDETQEVTPPETTVRWRVADLLPRK
jgi:Uma2 family endonuclease